MKRNNNLFETIETIKSRINTIEKVSKNGFNDLDSNCLEDLESSMKILDNIVSKVLENQKKRGKEFISNDSIDNIINSIKKENGYEC